MRSFAQKASLRLVTGSRSKLRELCKTDDSVTSDFWEVFHPNPLRVGGFEDHDWDGFLKPLRYARLLLTVRAGRSLPTGLAAFQYSPPFCELVFDVARDGSTVTKTHIDEIGMRVFEERSELIGDIWDDCNSELQAEIADLQSREIPVSKLTTSTAATWSFVV